MKKRVLVTGGAGFIGSHLVDGLLADGGYTVRVIDNLSTGHIENLAHVIDDIEFIEGDIGDRKTVEAAMVGVDAILHEAALPSVPRSIADPVASNAANVSGTVNLLDVAQRHGVERFVLASSSSVYGDLPVLPKSEEMTPLPRSPYAVSKLAGEYYTACFARLHGMSAFTFRYFNVFGPRQDPTSQYSGVVAKFMDAALDNTQYTFNGDGSQSRDFTYVANVVDGNIRSLKADGLAGQVANLACGCRYTLLDLADAIDAAAGVELPRTFAPPRVGDVMDSLASIECARELIGYEPLVTFEEGIRRTYEWYRDHRAH